MERKINIVLVHARNIFEQDGAGSNRWRTMVEGLSAKGIDITIVFTQGFGSITEIKNYGFKGKIGNISYNYTIFLLQSSLWMRRISGYLLSPLFKGLNILLLRRILRKHKPDIIWLQPNIDVFDVYQPAVKKPELAGYKLMIELNEFHDIGLIHSTNKLQLAKSNRYSRVLLHEILPSADLLLIMTRKLLEHYRTYTNPEKAKFLHLPMTVDMSRFSMEQKTKESYIAYCGSSSFVKDGVDILLKSFAAISPDYPGLKLKIAAFMEADGGKMLKLIDELKLNGKAVYAGELKRNEIPDFICNARVLLLPRPDSKQAQGGFPTKLGEYLATGNPVCATCVGEIPEYLVDNESVFFAEPGSIDSFTEALKRALSDPENAAMVGLNGKQVAKQNFDMGLQAENLYNFIVENIEA